MRETWDTQSLFSPSGAFGPGTWTASPVDCVACYNDCKANGNTWNFGVCPIAGGLENEAGPRWPGPNDISWPVLPR